MDHKVGSAELGNILLEAESYKVIDQLLLQGYKIHAIKYARMNFVEGLKEAKDLVEARALELSMIFLRQHNVTIYESVRNLLNH